MADKSDFEKAQKDFLETLQKMISESRIQGPDTEKLREETEEKRRRQRDKAFRFQLKPKEVKKHLDRFVIKQEEAKRVLATTVCDHYNHVRLCGKGEKCKDYTKQNVLLLGPTGVGKTYLIRSLAELIGVPFVKSDATKFSETGYVGRDADDLVRDLVHRAEGDIELAEYGIVYLDEVDKIARASNIMGRDVSGAGVQQGLLKLMEETEVLLRNPQDVQSQVEAMMEYQQKGKVNRPVINTRHILFIVSGAFTGLDSIVQRRLRTAQIGFQPTHARVPKSITEMVREVETEDFIEYGFEPEFVGRLPVRAVCDPLTAEDLYLILTTSEGSVLKQFMTAFAAYGIEMKFEEKALWQIAKQAQKEKTGARGLVTALEKTLRDLRYELPSSVLTGFTLTSGMVEDPKEGLKTLLKKDLERKHKEIDEEISAFERDFHAKNKIAIDFNKGAREEIFRRVFEEDLSVGVFLDKLLSNYVYGLGLIQQKKKQDKFILPVEVVRNPNLILDQWIKEAYE